MDGSADWGPFLGKNADSDVRGSAAGKRGATGDTDTVGMPG
jgi:hypothetical protein